MDKHRLFELSQQLREVDSKADFDGWFHNLKKEIAFDFSILGQLSTENPTEPLCFDFPRQTFLNCFRSSSLTQDPLFSALPRQPCRITALMDPMLHPDYGRRLLIAGRHYGDDSSIFLVAFGDRQPSSDEIDILYLLAPHLYHVSSTIAMKAWEGKPSLPATPCLLTSREKELLPWLKMGKSNWEISRLLNISERTVKYHLHNIYKKLDVHNRTHAAARAMEMGWYDS